MALWSTFIKKQTVSLHGRMLVLFRHVLNPTAETFPESFLGGDGFHDVLRSEADSLTAAGTTQAGALVLTAVMNRLSTVASSSGVQLPIMHPGMIVWVVNDGANPVTVYPNTGDVSGATIDGVAAATGVTLTNARRGWYACFTGGTIVSGYQAKSA